MNQQPSSQDPIQALYAALITFAVLMFSAATAHATPEPAPDSIRVYKTVDEIELKLHIFYPKDHRTADRTPAMVFFHGGGWQHGRASMFYERKINEELFIETTIEAGRFLASLGFLHGEGSGTYPSPQSCLSRTARGRSVGNDRLSRDLGR